MEYFIRHRTTYRYLQDVSHSWHLAHLRPRATPLQSVRKSDVRLSLEAASHTLRGDYFENPCEWISIDQPHTELEIVAESRVTVEAAPERASRNSLAWEALRGRLENPQDDEERDVVQYQFDTPMTRVHSDVAAYGAVSFPPGRPMLAGAMELMNRIHKDFRYDTTVTDVSTPLDKVFEIRAGVCQDLAHVAIAAMRAIGLPARYVSGYLLTKPPPGRPRLLGSDASHAWFSVWAPPFGWVDLDPTNDLVVGESHVTASWGRDYADVAPVSGIILGGHDHVVEVGVDVIPQDDAGPEVIAKPPIAPKSRRDKQGAGFLGPFMTSLLVLLIALGAMTATMTGGMLALKLEAKLPLVMGFSAGAVIGVAFFDLAPEALEAGKGLYEPRNLLAVAALGFFLYTLVDRLVARHDCEGQPNPTRGLVGAASFSAHSILDGFAMGVAFQASREIGLIVAAAVLAHDFADGLNTVNVVTKNGGDRSFALRWLAVDAAAPVVGAGLSLLVAPSTGMLSVLLALFCGFFLHIGASGLLPESHRAYPRPATTVATLLGAAFLYGVTELVR